MTLDNILNDVFLYNSYNTPLTPISKMLAYDGLHSGVPTRTTATLTPTTLKNIEQTFIELTSDPPTSVPHQAGFVPPFAPTFYQVEDSSDSSVDSMNSSTSWHTTPPPPSVVSDEIMSSKGGNNNNNNETTGTGKKRRNMGGRRPNKPSNLSPEEEEKRRVRRERNKLAAARCRRRREDHTSELLTETEGLERKKQSLQNEFQNLQQKKEELEFLLDSHRAYCRMSGAVNNRSGSPLDVKPQITNVLLPVEKIKAEPIDQFDDDDGEPMAKRVMLSQAADLSTPTSTIPTSLPSIINIQQHHRQNHQQLLNNFNSGHQNQKFHFQQQIHSSQAPTQNHKPSRPSSLKVPFQLTPSDIINNAGVAITTPSGGNSFNFDSLMDGGTGLTPTVAGPLLPNLNRSSLDLMTPTSEPSRFVSL